MPKGHKIVLKSHNTIWDRHTPLMCEISVDLYQHLSGQNKSNFGIKYWVIIYPLQNFVHDGYVCEKLEHIFLDIN